jgi:ABC-type transporter Mla subunit MlaD
VSGAVGDVEAATSDFADGLRGLGRPDTEAGQEANELVDQLAGNVEENVSTMRSAVDGASGLSGIVEATNAASAALSAMDEQLSSTFAELEELDAGGELQAAFGEADSCNEFESAGP